MIESILIAFIIALFNRINIIPILTLWPMIPIYLASLFYIIAIILELLKINNPLKKCMIIVWILPTISIIYFGIQYQLYIRLLVGLILFVTGIILNIIACKYNNNRMPVFPSLSYCTKFFTKEKANKSDTHQLGHENTKVIPLTDIIDLGYNVFSIGDILIFGIFGIIIYGIF
jgi:hypothetical protein